MNNIFNKLEKDFDKYYLDEITVRKFVRSDVFPLFDATKNKDFNQFLLWEQPKTLDECLMVSEKFVVNNRVNNMFVLSIVNKDSGEWLGLLKFMKVEFEKSEIIFEKNLENSFMGNEIEATLWIHPKIWETKIGFKAIQLYMDMILNKCNYDSAIIRVNNENFKANGLCKKLGFLKIGQIYVETESRTNVLFNIFKITKSNITNDFKIIKFMK